MKPKQPQPIFVITKESFDDIFNVLRNHTPLPTAEYGFATKEEINKSLGNIKFDENNEVLVTKVVNVLDSFRSHKLSPPRINSGLDKYKALVKGARKNKTLSLTKL